MSCTQPGTVLPLFPISFPTAWEIGTVLPGEHRQEMSQKEKFLLFLGLISFIIAATLDLYFWGNIIFFFCVLVTVKKLLLHMIS